MTDLQSLFQTVDELSPDELRERYLYIVENHVEFRAEKQSEPEKKQRVLGLGAGKPGFWMSEDFDDELPDEFWFGEDGSVEEKRGLCISSQIVCEKVDIRHSISYNNAKAFCATIETLSFGFRNFVPSGAQLAPYSFYVLGAPNGGSLQQYFRFVSAAGRELFTYHRIG